MPTPLRAVRVPDDLWEAARAQAYAEGTTVTAVILAALQEYTGSPPWGPDSRVLQPCPEAADQALARSIEEHANSQGHDPMMASHGTGPAPGRARPGARRQMRPAQ